MDFRHADNPEPFSKIRKENESMADWYIDRVAELEMVGMTNKDAREKAMEEWHTYKAHNISS